MSSYKSNRNDANHLQFRACAKTHVEPQLIGQKLKEYRNLGNGSILLNKIQSLSKQLSIQIIEGR